MRYLCALSIALLTCRTGLAFYNPKSLPAPDPRKNERVEKLFESMLEGKYKSIQPPQLGWSDIPALLSRADSTEPLKNYPTNVITSLGQRRCSEGAMALWLAEGVRMGRPLPSLNALCLKTGQSEKDLEKASEENQADLVKAYRAWWEKVKNLKPEEAARVDPLEGTGLYWYGAPSLRKQCHFPLNSVSTRTASFSTGMAMGGSFNSPDRRAGRSNAGTFLGVTLSVGRSV